MKVGRGRPRKHPLPTKDEKSEDEEDMFMSTETDDVEGNEEYSESSDEGSDDYENSNDSNVRQREYMSIYMREKSNKRQIIKNGKVNIALNVSTFLYLPLHFIFYSIFLLSKFSFSVVENREKFLNYMFKFVNISGSLW